jgi:transcriptional/translational regulatory protein YebC/TACO1
VLPGEEEIEIFAPADKFHSVVQALDKAGIKITESELRMEPNQKLELAPDQAVSVMKLIEQLEELDDVDSIFTNLDFTDAAIKAMQEQG